MPTVPGEALLPSILAARIPLTARVGDGSGRRGASACRRWLPIGSPSG